MSRPEVLLGDTRSLSDAERWDLNAERRDLELSTHSDPSYRALTNLICSYIQSQAIDNTKKSVLDVGCGLGYLTQAIDDMGLAVCGIDPSTGSTDRARERAKRSGQSIEFQTLSLEQYASKHPKAKYDIIVANMTLHCVAYLPAFMSAVARILKDTGYMVATIPNPDTYLQGRTDLDLHQIDLRQEQVLDMPFRIRGHVPHPVAVRFYHHPYRAYLAASKAASLPVNNIFVPEQIGLGKPRDIALLEFGNR